MERLVVVKKRNGGFTLLEMLIALVIAGILSAVSLPSLLKILKGNEVKAAQDQIVSLLRDAQKQAIRRSKKCELTIDTTNNQVRADGADNVGCLSTSDGQLSSSIAIRTTLTGSPPKITYNFRGHTNKLGTIVIYPKNWSSGDAENNRCIVISETLGIMRSGVYKENPTSGSPNPDHCETSTSTL